jgi:hypothetical protein
MMKILFAACVGLALLAGFSAPSNAENSCARECHRTCTHAQNKNQCVAACFHNCSRR